jgi:hypothetical protein
MIMSTGPTHEQLVGYATETAAETQAAWESGEVSGDTLSPDVFLEAELAWLATGLLPSPQRSSTSQHDIDTICRAIVARTAIVLILNGWTPPA